MDYFLFTTAKPSGAALLDLVIPNRLQRGGIYYFVTNTRKQIPRFARNDKRQGMTREKGPVKTGDLPSWMVRGSAACRYGRGLLEAGIIQRRIELDLVKDNLLGAGVPGTVGFDNEGIHQSID